MILFLSLEVHEANLASSLIARKPIDLEQNYPQLCMISIAVYVVPVRCPSLIVCESSDPWEDVHSKSKNFLSK